MLVIDDEVLIATVLSRMLAPGHEVVVTNRGRDALAILADDRQPPFDVVLCDLMMPEVGGEDVYAEVVRTRPEMARRFIFMSGGAFTPRGRQFRERVQAPVLDEPFDVGHLRAIVAAYTGRSGEDR